LDYSSLDAEKEHRVMMIEENMLYAEEKPYTCGSGQNLGIRQCYILRDCGS